MLDRIVDLLAVVAGVVLCALIGLIVVDLTARNFKLFAIPWSLEIAQIALYSMTFFAAPWVLKMGGHIAVDLLAQGLSEPGAKRLARFTNAIGAIVSGVLCYYSVRVLITFILDGQLVYGAMIYPRWLVYLPATLTFFLMFLIFARWVVYPSKMTEARTGSSEGL